MGFFRGIESHYTPRAEGLRAVPEALLGLIGTAPIHHCAPENRSIHGLRLVASQEQGRRLFGPDLDPYTIPMGVTVNHLEDGPLMMIINVFDPARHYREIGPLPFVFNAQGCAALPEKDWISAEIRDESGATLYEEGKDYLFDRVGGEVRRLKEAKFAPNAALAITGRLGDPSKVTAAEVIGGIAKAGVRSGMHLWRAAFQSLGFYPTDLTAPIFETLPSVRAALEAIAGQIRAIAHCQMPAGLSVQEALSARGGDGIAQVQVSSPRVKLFYPQYRSPRAGGGDRLVPLSLGYAAVFGRTLRERGFWWTGSNQPLRSASGFEHPVTFGGEEDEANLLNAAGISTLRANWGGSIHTWGPSTSAFPEEADPVHFDSIRRFYDILDRRVALSLLQYIDRPLTPALIEIILSDINGFYDDLIKRGALIAGRSRFHPDDNPPESLAQGHFVTRDDLVPPPPFQRFTRTYRFDRGALLAAFAAA